MKIFLLSFCFILFIREVKSQTFPNPATLSTGQGAQGTNDPIWTVSDWIFGAPPSPIGLTYVPAYISNNCAPGAWIDPASLAPPVNNGNWITGADAPCTGQTGYRYFRLTLNLPADCGNSSVTVAGNYILYLQGYVDNTLMGVYINGNDEGVPSGGSFSAGTQVSMALDGPWVTGVNYVDFLVYNGGGPYGLLLVADQTANSNTDSDNDGISNINDQCPCDSGNNSLGCVDPPHPNNCNTALIRQTFVNAGCTELSSCNNGCSMYFYNPQSLTGDNAQAFAQSRGASLISVQSATENTCIVNALNAHGFGGVIWIGFNDTQTEGSFVWYDQSPITYTNWAAGEPNNAGDEDCTQIYADGGWNDLDCSSGGSSSVIEVNLCPVVSIAPTVTSVCVGQSTTLTASTLLGSAPYTYTWTSSPAGFNSSSANPTVSPLVTTTYLVTSTDRYGCVSQTSITVTVNSVTASVGANSPCVGQSLNLTSGPAGMVNYNWLAANGYSSAVQNPTINNVTAASGGIYGVLVTDGNGCQDTAMVNVTIKPLPTPTASSNTPICVGQTLNLNSGGGGTYSWWGPNGFSSVIQAPSRTNATAAQAGVYHVSVTGANGCVDSTTTTVVVNPLPIPSASSNTPLCVGQTLNLTSGGGISYQWWGPSGFNAAAQNPTRTSVIATYSGAYHVKVTDANGCIDSTTTAVIVNPLPNPTASSNTPVCFGQTLTLTGGPAAMTNYAWWGPNGYSNATQSPTVNATAILANGGTYHLSVTDANGCVDSITTTVVINPLPNPIVSNNGPRCADSTITLTAAGGTGYSWWGPNNFSSAISNPQIVNAQITHNGIYHVTVTDANGCVDSSTTTVLVHPEPVANAGADGSVCAGNNATLTGSGAGAGGTYSWLPSGTGSNSGSYTVTPAANIFYELTVTDIHGCKDMDSAKISVNPLPVVNFTAAAVCYGTVTNFVNSSVDTSGGGAMTCFWNFGDPPANGTTTNCNPAYSYSQCGNYNVTLVETTDSGCVSVLTKTVIVNCIPVASFSTTNVCFPTVVTFNNTSTISDTSAMSYNWDYNYIASTHTSDFVTTTNNAFNNYTDGTYVVDLIASTAAGCADTISHSVTVYPKPNADFSTNNVCLHQATNFTDLSSVNAPDNIATWEWDYNYVAPPPFTFDYTAANGTGASNIYPNLSATNAALVVTSNNGCKDTVIHPITIYPLPVPSFTVPPVCLNTTSLFTNNSSISSGSISAYNWEFDTIAGGPSSSVISPTYNYTTSGDFPVQLTATSNFGCIHDTVIIATVYPNPVVDFTTDVFKGCEPVCVNLSDQSTISATPPGSVNASYQWSFGDSTSGNSPLESHCYDNDGLYDVGLTVSSNKGCVTTLVKPFYITVYPNPTAEFTADPMVTTILNPYITFIDASSGGSYLNWDFGDSSLTALSNTSENILHTYGDTGTYIVTQTVTTAYNCVDSIQHTIIISPDFIFYAPNAFTPNRDDLNDVFNGKAIGVKEYEMKIFDRWGNKITTLNMLSEGWDGTKGGAMCPVDVYVWQVRILDLLGKDHYFQGTVTLVK